jgi:predicted nucleic acid-binding protein
MGWIERLKGHTVALDTSPFIYFSEENPTYFKVVEPFFEAVGRSEITVVTSIVTLLEVLVYPNRNGNAELAKIYRDLLFKTKDLRTMPVDQDIAEEAARLRAFHNIRTPDSIQIATAIIGKASFFLTNDKSLASLTNLKILVLDDLKNDLEAESQGA